MKKNKQGEAFTASSYQAFILKVVAENGGIVLEDRLDEMIEEAYGPLWGPTDLECWGQQKHPKWKQNVASAKSGLDRRGIVVRYEADEEIPISRPQPGWKVCQRKRQWYRIVTSIYRVRLPERTFLAAYDQWRRRLPPKQKQQYERLEQPRSVHFVPE